ncbi:hypothetical protein D3C76_960810 [compost metagenome]
MPDSTLCPACGASNRCTLADPRTAAQPCWCFSVSIDTKVLQALPADVRDKACLCPRCAQQSQTAGKDASIP